MSRPGWRPPEAQDRASSRPPLGLPLPTANAVSLGGGLWPGLHLLYGAHGSGKTQFIVQTAVHAALQGISARVHLPEVEPKEAALRVAAILTGTPWSALAQDEPDDQDRAFASLEGAPFLLDALGGPETSPLDLVDEGSRILALDPMPAEPDLKALRKKAVLAGVSVLAAAPSQRADGSEPAHPIDWAGGFGATDEALRVADSVWVLAPSLEGSGTRLGLAKSRRARSGVVHVLFDGAKFVDDSEELNLELEL